MTYPFERWSRRDLAFVVETLLPERPDPENVIDVLQEDEEFLNAMLGDDRIFQRMMSSDEVFVSVSPGFFFHVLLLRARRDLEQESYTVEHRHLQKVVLFDARQVVDLLSRPEIHEYLAAMLASFTKINSLTIPIRVRPGIWHRVRINDLDVDSLIRYTNLLDEDQRFPAYQRIADACLFLAGLFPEYTGSRRRAGRPAAQPSGASSRLRSSLLTSLEDYEAYGQSFYRLAADHEAARLQALDGVLTILSDEFVLAEKPLAFVAERYLSLQKHHLFEI